MADYVSRERTMPVRFTDLEQKWNEQKRKTAYELKLAQGFAVHRGNAVSLSVFLQAGGGGMFAADSDATGYFQNFTDLFEFCGEEFVLYLHAPALPGEILYHADDRGKDQERTALPGTVGRRK